LQETLLRSAEEACSRGLALAHAEKDEQAEMVALVQRVDVRLLLKEKAAAIADAVDAHKLAPEDPGVMLAVAQARFACGEIEDGISVLNKAYGLHLHLPPGLTQTVKTQLTVR
jgi:predicted Zn-dependent protease